MYADRTSAVQRPAAGGSPLRRLRIWDGARPRSAGQLRSGNGVPEALFFYTKYPVELYKRRYQTVLNLLRSPPTPKISQDTL